MAEDNHIIIHLHKPGLREKLFFLFSGVIVSIPITLFVDAFSRHLCFMLPVIYSVVCTSSIFVPFIEEFAKAFPLFYRHGETERSIFTLGFLTGLGFGITEFFLYVIGSGASVSVRLPAIFFHASSTSIIAYGIAKKQPAPFYIIAVVLHLSNNIFAISGDLWFIGGPVVLLITYFLAWQLYRQTEERIISDS